MQKSVKHYGHGCDKSGCVPAMLILYRF